MRVDGRNADQMRSVKITPDFISTAEGSVLIELGNTRVICTATVDDGVPGFLKGSGKGWVTSEYGMLPRATEERTRAKRRAANNPAAPWKFSASSAARSAPSPIRSDGRAHRLDRLRRDPGRRRHAHRFHHRRVRRAGAGLRTHGRRGNLAQFPLIDTVAATSVGIVDDRALLDLAYEEDSRAEVDMNVVMTGSGHFVEIQATAEGRPFAGSEMQDLLASPPPASAASTTNSDPSYQ